MSMTEAEIAQYIFDTFPGVETAENLGYTFFFYGADHNLPFATLATADNDYDRVSNLNRPGVFRLNIGVGKQTFQSLFALTAWMLAATITLHSTASCRIQTMLRRNSSACSTQPRRHSRECKHYSPRPTS